ncbi:MAG: hypothetical protein MUQ10_00075 [Anaerolineae bacterium]|nr:hypothetical protein [Anaerolineae bacterium]
MTAYDKVSLGEACQYQYLRRMQERYRQATRQDKKALFDEVCRTLHSAPLDVLPWESGQPRREDYVYARRGTWALLLAGEPLAGKRRVWARSHRTKLGMAEVLRDLENDGTNGNRIYDDVQRLVETCVPATQVLRGS